MSNYIPTIRDENSFTSKNQPKKEENIVDSQYANLPKFVNDYKTYIIVLLVIIIIIIFIWLFKDSITNFFVEKMTTDKKIKLLKELMNNNDVQKMIYKEENSNSNTMPLPKQPKQQMQKQQPTIKVPIYEKEEIKDEEKKEPMIIDGVEIDPSLL